MMTPLSAHSDRLSRNYKFVFLPTYWLSPGAEDISYYFWTFQPLFAARLDGLGSRLSLLLHGTGVCLPRHLVKMLRESDIDSLHDHLASLSAENKRHNDNLQDLLSQFQSLLSDYSSLKSDYEDVKEGREKYKRLARGQVRAIRHLNWTHLNLQD